MVTFAKLHMSICCDILLLSESMFSLNEVINLRSIMTCVADTLL